MIPSTTWTPWAAWAAEPSTFSPLEPPAWSEATQLALLWGDGVTPLDGRWAQLLWWLPELGPLGLMVENSAAALAVTRAWRRGPEVGGWACAQAEDAALHLDLPRISYGFATGTPRDRGLPPGISLHDAHGERAVAMEVDPRTNLDELHGLARRFAAPRGLGLRGPPPARPERSAPGAAPGRDALEALWSGAHDPASLTAALRAAGLRRGELYFSQVGRGLVQLQPGDLLGLFRIFAATGEQIRVEVGRGAACLTAELRVAHADGDEAQLVAQGPEVALAVDLRFVRSAWIVRFEAAGAARRVVELLDENGDLLMRVGPRREGEAADLDGWTSTGPR